MADYPDQKKPGSKPRRRSFSDEPYDKRAAQTILKRIAGGETLKAVCRDADLPEMTTVGAWILDNRSGFADQFARARELQALAIADDLIDIADQTRDDWRETPKGNQADLEHIQRTKLRLDTRKWLLANILLRPQGPSADSEDNLLNITINRFADDSASE